MRHESNPCVQEEAKMMMLVRAGGWRGNGKRSGVGKDSVCEFCGACWNGVEAAAAGERAVRECVVSCVCQLSQK